jgi:glycosyltransferase involved in cell wall biosynthesis
MRRKRIAYVQYTNPADYPPLLHSARIFANHDWEILFLGTGSYGGPDLEVEAHPQIKSERWTYHGSGWRQKLHYLRFARWALRRMRQWGADWCYASDLWSCPIARWARIPVVYHEHDTPNEAGRLPRRLVLRNRAVVARRAVLSVLPNEERRSAFQTRFPAAKTLGVMNCPLRDEVLARRESNPTDPSLVLYYHGSIVPERLPEAVIPALAQLPEFVRLRFAGYETLGSRGYAAALMARARATGLADRVEFLGKLPARAQLLSQMQNAHIGLSFVPEHPDDANLRTMAGASNKAFEYLAAGLPLLVTDRPEWRRMFVEPGYALPCDPADPAAVANAVRQLANSTEARLAMGESGRQRVLNDWNYETQFEPVRRRLSGEHTA